MTEKHLDRRNADIQNIKLILLKPSLSIYSRFQCSMPPHHLLMYKIHESYAISVSIVLSTSHAFHHSRCSRAFGKILKPGEFNGGGTAAGWSSVFFVWIEFNFPHPLSHFTDKLDWISRWVFHPQGLCGGWQFSQNPQWFSCSRSCRTSKPSRWPCKAENKFLQKGCCFKRSWIWFRFQGDFF